MRDKVNSKSAAPPYNFVYVDACYTSADNTLAEAFLPYTNLAVDRAFLGWTTSAEDDIQNVNFSQQVVQDLSSGMTLKDAITDATTKYTPFYTNDTTGQRVTAVTGTFGDENMKLRSYYGGTGTDWYLLKP